MDSPLKLLIYAIAFAALLYAIYAMFIMPQPDAEKEIKKGIEWAHGNAGKIYSKELQFKDGFALRAQNMESPIINIRFECSSPETCTGQKMEIDAKRIFAKQAFSIYAHFRCKPIKSGATQLVDDCVVYFGEKPANIEIQKALVPEKISQSAGEPFSFELVNTGEISAASVDYEILFYLIRTEGMQKTEVLKNNAMGQIAEIKPGQSYGIARQVPLDSPGKYKVKITASSEDGGIAEWEKEIVVEQSANQGCKATEKGKTVLEEEVCKTEYKCEGCDFGYECALRWKEKGIDAGEGEVYPAGIKVTSQPTDGQCAN